MAVQGKLIAEQSAAISGHLSTATQHFSESLAIVKAEVGELKALVSDTAVEARDKVALVSRTIDRTHTQVALTTDFIQSKVIEPARELAAIMAGFRCVASKSSSRPCRKPINQTYAEDEMFIGLNPRPKRILRKPEPSHPGWFGFLSSKISDLRSQSIPLVLRVQNHVHRDPVRSKKDSQSA